MTTPKNDWQLLARAILTFIEKHPGHPDQKVHGRKQSMVKVGDTEYKVSKQGNYKGVAFDVISDGDKYGHILYPGGRSGKGRTTTTPIFSSPQSAESGAKADINRLIKKRGG